jgi:hypothetical protein
LKKFDMMHLLPPLLADLREVIGAVVFLLFLVLWVVSQLMEGKKQAGAPPAKGQGGPGPAPRPGGGPQAGAKPPVGGGLRSEMEEFMRRAGLQGQAPGNRPAPQRSPQPATADRVEVLVDDKPAPERQRLSTPSRPLEQRTPPTTSPTTKAADMARPAPPPRRRKPKRESVAEHVAQQFASSTRSVAEHTSRLGQRIIADDEQFDVQLKAKFDHDLGTLSASRTDDVQLKPVDGPATPAAQIAAMLASPEGVRQAILLNEIMRRPSDRW